MSFFPLSIFSMYDLKSSVDDSLFLQILNKLIVLISSLISTSLGIGLALYIFKRISFFTIGIQ